MDTENVIGGGTKKDRGVVSRKAWIDDDLFRLIHREVPIVCVDLLIMGGSKILLCKRKYKPEEGKWYIPGGRLLKGEKLDEAAHRIMAEETGMKPVYLRHLGWDTTIFKEDPFDHGTGTHTVNALFHAVPEEMKGDFTCDQHIQMRWTAKGLVEKKNPFRMSYDFPERVRRIARMI